MQQLGRNPKILTFTIETRPAPEHRGGTFPSLDSSDRCNLSPTGTNNQYRIARCHGCPVQKKGRTFVTSNLTKAALRGATCLALCVPAAAWAQDAATTTTTATEPQADAEDTSPGEAILVTGSRIRQPNLESANPIAVVTGEQVFETGNISVGDLLNELPQLRSTFSQQNGTRFLGTRGLNLLDLRGLGTQRTLVLVNGRRHVGSDVLSNGVSVDTNTIPSDLIERIDVVTGGASAVYGSDAVAGVVNFVLKDDFEGVQVRGQAGVSKYHDAGNQFIIVETILNCQCVKN